MTPSASAGRRWRRARSAGNEIAVQPFPVVRRAALSEPETGPIGVMDETLSSARLNVGLASLALMPSG